MSHIHNFVFAIFSDFFLNTRIENHFFQSICFVAQFILIVIVQYIFSNLNARNKTNFNYCFFDIFVVILNRKRRFWTKIFVFQFFWRFISCFWSYHVYANISQNVSKQFLFVWIFSASCDSFFYFFFDAHAWKIFVVIWYIFRFFILIEIVKRSIHKFVNVRNVYALRLVENFEIIMIEFNNSVNLFVFNWKAFCIEFKHNNENTKNVNIK